MRFRPVMALLPLLLVGSAPLVDSQEPKLKPAQEVMWRKLDLSHKVLEALVLDDFGAMEAYAEDLASLSRAGEWIVSPTEGYRKQSREFRRAVDGLARAATARDAKAAAEAYGQLTLRCIGCHHLLGGLPRR